MMSEKELLSSPMVHDQEITSTSLEDVELSINDRVTYKEYCKECFRPLCQVRKVKSKGAILVIIWQFLTVSVSYLALHNLSEIVNGWTFAILLFNNWNFITHCWISSCCAVWTI